jgi:carbonic anhydrase
MQTDVFPPSLLDGYRSFREVRYPSEHQQLKLLAEVGQRPKIMCIGCCDSRVPLEIIFDAEPGEIFVVRNVANLVPPYHPDGDHHGTSAALEFAVRGLGVEHIVVLGHSQCGGVAAALNSGAEDKTDFIGSWVSILEPIAANVRENSSVPIEKQAEDLEHRGVQLSLRNLMGFPWIKTAVAEEKLKLHGAWFDVGSGELHVLDISSGQFVTV